MLAKGSTAMDGSLVSRRRVAACSSAARTSPIVWNRLAGSLRKQRVTIAREVRRRIQRRGSSRTIAAMVSIAEFLENARRPLSISYSTTPKEKISDRASAGLPLACSGDM